MKRTAMVVAAALLAGCASAETKLDPNATDAQMAFARLKLLVGHWTVPPPGEAAPAATEPNPTPPTPTPESPAEHPAAEHPAAEHPATEHPATEHPAAEHPATQHPPAAKHVPTPTPEQESGAAPTAEAKPPALFVEYAVTSGGHTLTQKLMAGASDEIVTNYYLDGEGLALVRPKLPGERAHMRLDVAHSTRDDFHFEWDATATDVDPKKDRHLHRGRIHFVDADTIECEWELWVDGKQAEIKAFTLSRANGGLAPLPK